MTYKDAVVYFRRYILPEVHKKYSKTDKPAVRQEWCVYVDSLCRGGEITSKQAAIWDNPF